MATLISFFISPMPTRIGLLADICTIASFLIVIFKGKESISKQIINLESKINIQNSGDNINGNKITGNNIDDTIKLLERYKKNDKEKYNDIMNKLEEHDKKISKTQHIEMKDNGNDNYTLVIEDIK